MDRKRIFVGHTSDHYAVYVEVEIKQTKDGPELSMCAEARKHGRVESCGQIIDVLDDISNPVIPAKRIRSMRDIWRRWHLNGMKAGCEHQRDEDWDKRPIDPSKPLNTYGKHYDGQRYDSWNMWTWVRCDEHPEGLMCKPCPVCGYKFGTAWLHEELPADVIAEVESW